MIASGYSLDLYCDVPLEDYRHRVNTEYSQGYGLARFSGEHRRSVLAEARRAGWRFDLGTGVAVCPTCVKAKRAPSTPASATPETET